MPGAGGEESCHMRYINLDHISSNPLLPEVKQAMIDAIYHDYHNPPASTKPEKRLRPL